MPRKYKIFFTKYVDYDRMAFVNRSLKVIKTL